MRHIFSSLRPLDATPPLGQDKYKQSQFLLFAVVVVIVILQIMSRSYLIFYLQELSVFANFFPTSFSLLFEKIMSNIKIQHLNMTPIRNLNSVL